MPDTVLVVDDSADVRLVCRVSLEYHGFIVLEAEDSAAALEIARTHAPDLVLLDVMLPEIDGWQILSELKSDSRTAGIPVIMLTARNRETDQIRGWRSGAADYIVKPFNPQALIPTLRAAIANAADAESQRRDRVDMLRFTQKLVDRAEMQGRSSI
jgi:DNA-binding response OmpR family regulator